LAAQLPNPSPAAAVVAPSAREFTALVEEFWFEAYHVAKYLARDELWLAKARDWTTKELLLRLVEWHAGARRGPMCETYSGKQLQKWVAPDVWPELHTVFAPFARRDSWAALLATMSLFRRLAQETAARAGFTYPADVDRHITGFILRLERLE
jgi:aminoglycoside 6-adenylyltransferase